MTIHLTLPVRPASQTKTNTKHYRPRTLPARIPFDRIAFAAALEVLG